MIPVSPLGVVVALCVVMLLGMLRNFLSRPDVAVNLASRPTGHSSTCVTRQCMSVRRRAVGVRRAVADETVVRAPTRKAVVAAGFERCAPHGAAPGLGLQPCVCLC